MKARVILAGFVLLAGCGESKEDYANAIRAAINQDKQAMVELKGKVGLWEALVGVNPDKIDTLVASMKSIDFRRCPKDFCNAYQAHIRAWEDYAVAYRAGHSTGSLEKAIEQTWLVVHDRARDYGVMDALK